ncbi:MAG: type II-A CRISPR-associated protein Csn2 [Erysipelotrichaceae bacterium]|nr:type II-A CRISPR-associated protein Csn2 [Erysipelotrichaceae bacterium]
MKLINKDNLCEINFLENEVNILVIENNYIFTKYIMDFYKQYNGLDGSWILSELDVEYKLDKHMQLIIDPISFDINSRILINKLYSDIEKYILSSEYILGMNNLNSLINDFITKLLEEFDYDFLYEEELDIKNLFKFVNLKFNDISSTLIEKISNYMSICSSLLKSKVFVFINIKPYLSEKELKDLYKLARYLKIQLVMIEPAVREKLEGEKYLIIDKDSCVIT